MKQLKLVGLAITAILALTSFTASLAQAAATRPNILPEGTAAEPLEAESSSGISTFGTGSLKVTSSKSKGTLSGTSGKLGSFNVTFEKSEIELIGTPCKGLATADTTGIILVEGKFHIRDYKAAGLLHTAAIFLLEPVHFECGAMALVAVLGCVAGAISPENEELTKTLTVTLAANGGKKDNTIITVLNEEAEAGKEEACQLLASLNGSPQLLSVEVTTQVLTKFKKGGKEVTVLVMPL